MFGPHHDIAGERILTSVVVDEGRTLWLDSQDRPYIVEIGYELVADDAFIVAFACSVCCPWTSDPGVPECVHVFAERVRRGNIVFQRAGAGSTDQTNAAEARSI
jgi:hypothetical protein